MLYNSAFMVEFVLEEECVMWLIIFFYSTVVAGLQHYIHDNAEEMSQEKVRAGLNPCVK